VNSNRETRYPLRLKLVALLALAVLLCGVTARAADESSTKSEKTTTTEKTETKKTSTKTAHHKGHGHHKHHKRMAKRGQRRVVDLRGEVSNLRRGLIATNREVRRIEHDIIVVPPPSPTAAPRTVGEHVAVIEQDLSETRRELAENLGVHIHGVVDATYEGNFNYPNNSTQIETDTQTPGFFTNGPNTLGPAAGGVKGGNPQSIVPGGRINTFRAFDTEANGFQLTQFNLHLDRTVESGVGFVLDLNFGKTAEILRFTTRYSNNNPGSLNNDIVDPTQAYLTYTLPVGHGVQIAAGKFVTLLGAEVISTYNNLNYNESRSFIFNFGIPFTHTGIRASYAFTDKVGLTLGVNNGWDDVSDNNDGKTVEGQIALTPVDWFSLAVSGTYGSEQVNRGNSQRGVIDTVAVWKTPIRGLTLVGEYDYGNESGPVTTAPIIPTTHGPTALFFPGPGILAANHKCDGVSIGVPTPINAASGTFQDTLCDGTDWQGAAGYIIVDLTDRISLVGRGEYFRDSDGVRTGIRQNLYEGTFTINYKVSRGLLARLEYRHDGSNTSPFPSSDGFVNGETVTAFGKVQPTTAVTAWKDGGFFGDTEDEQDTLEAALVYTF
jgi:hypothetical protein